MSDDKWDQDHNWDDQTIVLEDRPPGDTWRETLLETDSLQVTVIYSDGDWRDPRAWIVGVSIKCTTFDGYFPSQPEILVCAVAALAWTRVKLFQRNMQVRWKRVKRRLSGLFSR